MNNLLKEIEKYDFNYLGIKSLLTNELTNKHLTYKSNKHNNLNSIKEHLNVLNYQLIPDIIYTYIIEIHLSKTVIINGIETKVITITKNIKKYLVD